VLAYNRARVVGGKHPLTPDNIPRKAWLIPDDLFGESVTGVTECNRNPVTGCNDEKSTVSALSDVPCNRVTEKKEIEIEKETGIDFNYTSTTTNQTPPNPSYNGYTVTEVAETTTEQGLETVTEKNENSVTAPEISVTDAIAPSAVKTHSDAIADACSLERIATPAVEIKPEQWLTEENIQSISPLPDKVEPQPNPPAPPRPVAPKPVPAAPVSTSYDDVILVTDTEFTRLGWTEDQKRTWLNAKYEVRSRQLLSDEQLLELLETLKAMPTDTPIGKWCAIKQIGGTCLNAKIEKIEGMLIDEPFPPTKTFWRFLIKKTGQLIPVYDSDWWEVIEGF